MKIEVQMPKMGESLQEGTITKWLKKEGDKVERDEMILEISTDKVDTEVPSPVEGTLSKIIAEENETVEVGAVIAEIETESDDVDAENIEVVDEDDDAKEQDEKEEETEDTQEQEENSDEDEEEEDGDLITIEMPKMGESLQEGTITNWLKKEGDEVERDEMILEISTDKVDTEVPSPAAGKIVEILAEENETVEVGTPIAKISTTGKSPKKSKTKKSKSSSKKDKTEKKESKPKDKKKVDAPEDGGTKEIPSRKDGKFFSPLVRKIAEDKGVTLEELMQLDGSGVDGRVSKQDLLDYLKEREEKPAAKKEKKAEKPAPEKKKTKKEETAKAPSGTIQDTEELAEKFSSIPDSSDIEVIQMNRLRQLIADHMVYSKRTSAHVTSVGEADVTDIFRFRNAHKAKFQDDEGFKLTFTPFFAKAIIDAVKEFPMVNVSVDGKNILRHKKIHLGVATALPDGNLIVPVVKSADALSITGLARQINDLAYRARNKKLDPDDIQGGTITATNVGTFGTLFGTPVINQPQAAIIGIGAIKKRPVVKQYSGEDVIVARDMVYMSITYDHRVIDGMLAGQCLASIIKHLESMNDDTISL